MKYRKRPVVIEAIQWQASLDSMRELTEFGCPGVWDKLSDHITIPTLEGNMRCDVWDYVIKGVRGEFYPCKPDIFEMTYEELK